MEKELIKIMEKYNDIAKATTKLCDGRNALGKVEAQRDLQVRNYPGNHRWSIKRSLALPWGGPIGR